MKVSARLWRSEKQTEENRRALKLTLEERARINEETYGCSDLPPTISNVSEAESTRGIVDQRAKAKAAYDRSLICSALVATTSPASTSNAPTLTSPASTSNAPTLTLPEGDASPVPPPTIEEGNNTSSIASSSRLVSYYNPDDDDDDSSNGGNGGGDDDGNDPAERDESGFIGGLLSGIGGIIDNVLDGIRKCCCPGDVTGHASTKRDSSGQAVSRVDVAAAAEPHVFDIVESKGIISSVIAADNPTLEDIEDAMKHLDICMKNCANANELLEFEQFKCLVLVKFIPKQLAVKPSIQTGYLTGRLSKEDEKNEKKKLTKWSAPLISAVSSLHKSIETLEKSERYTATPQIGSFKTFHARYVDECIQAIKPSTTSNSRYRLVKFMNDNYVHTNLSNVANNLMASSKSSQRVVEILQEKLDLLERALASLDPTSNTMSDTDFLEEWNRLEEEEVEAVKQVVCTEGMTARVKDGDTGERITIDVVMPNQYWELNRLTTVKIGQLCIALKNWHPPTKDGDPTGEPDLSNGCLRAVNELDPLIVHTEGGGTMSDDLKQEVKGNIAIFDLHDLFPKTKTHWKKEFEKFVELSGLRSFAAFQLRGLTRLLAQHVLNKLSGERSHIAIYSAESSKATFTLPFGVGISKDITNAGTLPHGEAQCEPKIKMSKRTYSYQDLLNQSAQEVIFLAPINKIRTLTVSKSIAIIARRQDDTHLSPEAERLLRDMKKKWCVAGHKAAVEKVCIDNEEEFHQYVYKKLRVHVESDDLEPTELYKIMTSFFGSRGQNAAILSVCRNNEVACVKYCRQKFPNDGIVTLQDLNFEQKSSYFGYYISRTSAAGTLINHDPHQTLQWFGFNGDAVRTLLRDYNVPELRKFGLMLKCELEEECQREPTIQVGERMGLSRLTKVFMRFIKRVTQLTTLPNGWVMPYQIKMVSTRPYFSIKRTYGCKHMRIRVTPDSNGTKEITRNLSLIMISALEKFDPPVEFNDSTINYPRFSQQCKTMDSQPNPQHNLQPKVYAKATYQYLVLSKALMQNPRPIVAKFYLCPRPSCRFPYNLMDIDRIGPQKPCADCKVKSQTSAFTLNEDVNK